MKRSDPAQEQDEAGVLPGGLDDIDPLIHAPARLLILRLLESVEVADFVFVMLQTGLTQGNLSSHLSKLEDARYVRVQKTFVGKRPSTLLRLSPSGRRAFRRYSRLMRALLSVED